jgi:hypothetical protein
MKSRLMLQKSHHGDNHLFNALHQQLQERMSQQGVISTRRKRVLSSNTTTIDKAEGSTRAVRRTRAAKDLPPAIIDAPPRKRARKVKLPGLTELPLDILLEVHKSSCHLSTPECILISHHRRSYPNATHASYCFWPGRPRHFVRSLCLKRPNPSGRLH